MMEQWLGFAKEQWYVIVIAIIGLWIVFKLVKKAIKWVVIIAIIAAVLVYGFNYDLSDLNYEQFIN